MTAYLHNLFSFKLITAINHLFVFLVPFSNLLPFIFTASIICTSVWLTRHSFAYLKAGCPPCIQCHNVPYAHIFPLHFPIFSKFLFNSTVAVYCCLADRNWQATRHWFKVMLTCTLLFVVYSSLTPPINYHSYQLPSNQPYCIYLAIIHTQTCI